MSQTSTALITGASNGIGLELAKIHAKKGGNLVIVARSVDKLLRLKEELELDFGVKVTVIEADLSQPNTAQTIYQKTESLGLVIDTLINNAGHGGHDLFYKQDWKVVESMIQVNMAALTELTHLYLPNMIARRAGRILNVSSTASFMPGPLQAVYYATKSYVTSFSQAIAEENKDFGITVTALCPGAVNTGFVESGNLDGVDLWKKAKSAKSVASFGYRAMEKGDLVAFNESGLKFMLNWMVPLMPRKTVLKISRDAMEKAA